MTSGSGAGAPSTWVAAGLAERLAAASAAPDLEGLTRPLLEIIEEITDLRSTYLTRIHWERGEQEIIFSRNTGAITIPEGLRVEWSDTLCRRALEDGTMCTDDVPGMWGDSRAAQDLGIRTYVSAPVRLPTGEVFGTLCGASDERRGLDAEQQRMLTLFARLIADQVAREQARLSERRRAEAAEERLRARARFLAVAEHELKSPLTVVLGCADILSRGIGSEGDRTEMISAMQRSAERLRDRIDRMLEEARAEVIARELEPEDLDLASEVATTAAQFASATPTHVVAVPLSAPVRARGDRNAVYQIVSHLIENALKYSPDGSTITITTAAEEESAVIRVRDEGPGIPDGVDLFAPFNRGNPEKKGVGLGLHIVRTLATAMEGTVEAASNEPGPGATFTVRLPALEA